MTGTGRGVLELLRSRRPSPVHVVDPFKVAVDEAVLKAVAVERLGLPFLILASTDYEDFDARMPDYVARVKAAVRIPVITHFPARPGAGLPVAPGADAMLCPALLGSHDDHFVWKSILQTATGPGRGAGHVHRPPEMLLEAALTFGDDAVSFDAMATVPVERSPQALDFHVRVIRLLGFDVVYLYSRYEDVSQEVCRYFRQRLRPEQLIFVGGGIRTRRHIDAYIRAGADYVVFAGALETPGWRAELEALCGRRLPAGTGSPAAATCRTDAGGGGPR
ncbi:geranylgeranylglyceryl/heptaprenylglyceryl phosphate synthase [Streptomyces aureoversilis]|uniref:Geranylgeranylglyceryl/heptaprenylglyceryl phosphate synthase n=1 Tax=Streptomyces aureoversilis TaxID=67277 RepID=A0ABV9ZX01_9ACTN